MKTLIFASFLLLFSSFYVFAENLSENLNSNNPYEILGIAQDADPKDIKSQFRKLSMKYHPDKNPGKTGEDFVKILNAYEDVMAGKGSPRKAAKIFDPHKEAIWTTEIAKAKGYFGRWEGSEVAIIEKFTNIHQHSLVRDLMIREESVSRNLHHILKITNHHQASLIIEMIDANYDISDKWLGLENVRSPVPREAVNTLIRYNKKIAPSYSYITQFTKSSQVELLELLLSSGSTAVDIVPGIFENGSSFVLNCTENIKNSPAMLGFVDDLNKITLLSGQLKSLKARTNSDVLVKLLGTLVANQGATELMEKIGAYYRNYLLWINESIKIQGEARVAKYFFTTDNPTQEAFDQFLKNFNELNLPEAEWKIIEKYNHFPDNFRASIDQLKISKGFYVENEKILKKIKSYKDATLRNQLAEASGDQFLKRASTSDEILEFAKYLDKKSSHLNTIKARLLNEKNISKTVLVNIPLELLQLMSHEDKIELLKKNADLTTILHASNLWIDRREGVTWAMDEVFRVSQTGSDFLMLMDNISIPGSTAHFSEYFQSIGMQKIVEKLAQGENAEEWVVLWDRFMETILPKFDRHLVEPFYLEAVQKIPEFGGYAEFKMWVTPELTKAGMIELNRIRNSNPKVYFGKFKNCRLSLLKFLK